MTYDWDDAFANMAHIPGAAQLPDLWATQAAAYRATAQWSQTTYGAGARETLDVIKPQQKDPKGVIVLVHGGYWMRTSPSDWTHLAAGAVARGWSVVLPGYTLAPEARISQITTQIAQAIETVATQGAGPIRLVGHSAGGHLVARMVCDDTGLTHKVRARLELCMPISGLFDLRPLMQTEMNRTLQLTDAEARRESPALHRPSGHPRLDLWVGGSERPEFLRQTHLMATMWNGLGATIAEHVDPSHHHFSVIEGLSDPNSQIVSRLCTPV